MCVALELACIASERKEPGNDRRKEAGFEALNIPVAMYAPCCGS